MTNLQQNLNKPRPSLITIAYTAFNNRYIGTALTTMLPDVRWRKA